MWKATQTGLALFLIIVALGFPFVLNASTLFTTDTHAKPPPPPPPPPRRAPPFNEDTSAAIANKTKDAASTRTFANDSNPFDTFKPENNQLPWNSQRHGPSNVQIIDAYNNPVRREVNSPPSNRNQTQTVSAEPLGFDDVHVNQVDEHADNLKFFPSGESTIISSHSPFGDILSNQNLKSRIFQNQADMIPNENLESRTFGNHVVHCNHSTTTKLNSNNFANWSDLDNRANSQSEYTGIDYNGKDQDQVIHEKVEPHFNGSCLQSKDVIVPVDHKYLALSRRVPIGESRKLDYYAVKSKTRPERILSYPQNVPDVSGYQPSRHNPQPRKQLSAAASRGIRPSLTPGRGQVSFPNSQVFKRQQAAQQRGHQPTWKALWSKVEQKLDDLVNIEDMVVDRAKKLYSSTSAVLTDKVSLGSTANSKSIFNRKEMKSIPSSTLVNRQIKSLQNSEVPSKKIHSLGPLSNRSEVTQDFDYLRLQSAAGQRTLSNLPQAASRSIDWSTVKPREGSNRLIANGGASNVPNETPIVEEGATSRFPQATYSGRQLTRKEVAGDDRKILPSTIMPIHSAVATPRSSVRHTDTVSSREFWKNARLSSGNEDSLNSILSHNRSFSVDDDDTRSVARTIANLLQPSNLLSLLKPFRKERPEATSTAIGAWKIEEDSYTAPGTAFLGGLLKSRSVIASTKNASSKKHSQGFVTPLTNLMQRCHFEGKQVSLLNHLDAKECISIGHQSALFDVASLLLLVTALRIFLSLFKFQLPQSLEDVRSTFVPEMTRTFVIVMDSWAPYVLVAIFLTNQMRFLLSSAKTKMLVKNVESSVKKEAYCGVFFFRVLTSANPNIHIVAMMQYAARSQIYAKINTERLKTFVAYMSFALITMTASVLGPILGVGFLTIYQLFALPQWQLRPLNWSSLFNSLLLLVTQAIEELKTLIIDEFSTIYYNPTRFAFEGSVLLALVALSYLPRFERSRISTTVVPEDEDDVHDEVQRRRLAQQLWNLGATASNRLSLLPVNRLADVLERWQMIIQESKSEETRMPWRSTFRFIVYIAFTTSIISSPLLVYVVCSKSGNKFSNSVLRWDNLLDVVVVLAFSQTLIWNSLLSAVKASISSDRINDFVIDLMKLFEERNQSSYSAPADSKFQSLVVTSSGLLVKDLWVAHSSRRAWAVRGASLSCKSGEIIVLLGDEGSGRTRLLSAMAEELLLPAKRSLTTQKIRGTISVSGIDLLNWNRSLLKQRVVVILNDPRSQSDLAQALSGLSLEEILGPSDGMNNSVGIREGTTIKLALKMTGLYNLLPKFPSKLSTIVTASEEDMWPSSSGPRYQLLSPGEWSKLLLARTLTQALYDNSQSFTNTDSVANSLAGSVLLFDDVALHFSEIEEARLFKDLRQSGASTIITSQRWAIGRLADRIVVMKDGTIIESGTHNDLLQAGPQQSTYAAKWLAMTSI